MLTLVMLLGLKQARGEFDALLIVLDNEEGLMGAR